MRERNIITFKTIGRLTATIRRRLADFLDVDPQGGGQPSRAPAIDGQIEDLRMRIGVALAARRRLERDIPNPEEAGFSEKAEFAILHGRDDLARAAIQERIDVERRNQERSRDLAALDEEIAAIEAALRAARGGDAVTLKSKLRELDELFAGAGRTQSREK